MFPAILGLIIILVGLAFLVMVIIGNKGHGAKFDAEKAAAEAAYDKAVDFQNRFTEWYDADRDERKELDPNNEFQTVSRITVNDKVRAAERTVANYKSYDASERIPNGVGVLGFIVALIIGLLLILTQCFYRQDIGEAKVQVSWSGQLVGESTTPGFHMKAPWVSTRTFDVRNNLVTYVGHTEDGKDLPEYDGNVTTGPRITFQDQEGVTGNMDITLRYSLESGSVLDVYSNFGTQENFVNKVISQGVRAQARIAPSTRTTLEVYSDKAGLAEEIRKGLEERWKGLGIIIEDVAVQETIYSKVVTDRFDEAQAARIAVTKAQAEQDAAKVTAQTKVIEAQGVADAAVVAAQGQSKANDLLNQSLTDKILTQRYIDALKAGTVYVVPDGSTPFITTK